MNILIVGTGMYVTGRGTEEHGTILPAISSFQKERSCISKVLLAVTNVIRTQAAEAKSSELIELTGVPLPLKFYPQGKGSTKSYLDVLDKIKLPGCAIVAVPDHLHYEVTSACLEKGLHTLVVKPLTPTVV
jgi:predicted dehydrogenase